MGRGSGTIAGRLSPLARWALGATLLSGAMWSCSSGGGNGAPGAVGPVPGVGVGAPAESAATIISEEPWTYETAAGRLIRTPSYEIHTTLNSGSLIDRAPGFLERALANYTTVLGVLPRPGRPLETYLLATRSQWNVLTRKLLGDDAGPYLRIERGGFSFRGKGVYYDIGQRDTLVIAAHEGWHQYVQQSFRETPPVWLDEGAATYMEGFRWDAEEPTKPNFMPWANLERYETLRWAQYRDRLLPLSELLKTTPQELITSDENSPLRYYAQVWALVHFLREGEGGKYSKGLKQALLDLAHGGAASRIREASGSSAARAFSGRRDGVVFFSAYFGADIGEIDKEFRAFVTLISERGNRQKVAAGKSPILE